LLSIGDIKKWQVLDEKIIPNPETHKKYNEYYEVYHSIYQNLKNDMKIISKL